MRPHVTSTWTMSASWLFSVSSQPIPDGIVSVSGGRIGKIVQGRGIPVDLDLGRCALLPGLVNAHTHLDLSRLRGLTAPSPDFTGWLAAGIRSHRGQHP